MKKIGKKELIISLGISMILCGWLVSSVYRPTCFTYADAFLVGLFFLALTFGCLIGSLYISYKIYNRVGKRKTIVVLFITIIASLLIVTIVRLWPRPWGDYEIDTKLIMSYILLLIWSSVMVLALQYLIVVIAQASRIKQQRIETQKDEVKKIWIWVCVILILITISAVLLWQSRSFKIAYYAWRFEKCSYAKITVLNKNQSKIIDKLVDLNVMAYELPEGLAIREVLENHYLNSFGASKENLRKYLGEPSISKDDSGNESWTYKNRRFVFDKNGELKEEYNEINSEEDVIKRELNALKEAGEPMTILELAPPPIPKGVENAAPIYEELCLALMKNYDEDEDDIIDKILRKPDEVTNDDIVKARKILEKNKDIINKLKKAGEIKYCRMEVDYTKKYNEIKTPSAVDKYEAGRLLALGLIIKGKDGNVKEAMESLYAGSRLSRYGLLDPGLLSYMIRINILGNMLYGMERVLNQTDISPEMIKKFLPELISNKDPNAYLRSIQCERVMFIESLETEKDIVFKLQIMELIKLTNKIIDLLKVPYYEAKGNLEKLEKEQKTYGEELRSMFSVKATREIWEDCLKTESRLRMAQIALALKLYEAKHNKYPDSLDALSPIFLKDIPKDLFSGNDFVYRKESNGFIIYSVGRDLKDNGGKVEEDYTGILRITYDKDGNETKREKNIVVGDIIWKCER